MRVLKGTLTFVMGMIIGIVLFVIAIGGTLFAVASLVDMNQLQKTIGADIFDENSDILDETILDVAKKLLDDIKAFDKLTINEIIKRYGVKIPTELSGIKIDVLFDYPLSEIGNHLGDIVNAMTLRDIGEFLNMDFTEYGLPVLDDNMDSHVNVALDNLLKAIDGDSLSLGAINSDFGITLGDNQLFNALKYTPFSSFGTVLDGLTVGTLIDIDSDAFVAAGANAVYVKADIYEEVPAAEYGAVKQGADTYIAGAENGKLIYKELRYTAKKDAAGVLTGEYVVDNKSNAAGFTPDADNPVVYYRHISYVAYGEAGEIAQPQYYIPYYSNSFAEDSDGYSPLMKGYTPLSGLYFDQTLTSSLNSIVNGPEINIEGTLYYSDGAESPAAVEADKFGVAPEVLPNKDTVLESGYEGFYRTHIGTSDIPMQTIANITVGGLSNATDTLMSMKLSDLIDIDENSPQILIRLKDKPINQLAQSVDELVLADVTPLRMSTYVRDDAGIYVFVPSAERYVEYDAARHQGLTRYDYSFSPEVVAGTGKYVSLTIGNETKYFLYDKDDPRFEGRPRFDKVYSENPTGGYVKVSDGGYYTLYKPGDSGQRYAKLTTADGKDYMKATAAEISDPNVIKYVLTGSVMTEYTGSESGELYVAGTAASKILQRLAYVSVNDFSDEFSKLVLGDAMDIEADSYRVESAPFDEEKDYYYFDGAVYKPADSDFIAANPDITYYTVQIEGSGNAVLKKLAFVRIDDVSVKMQDVIDTISIGEIIEVVESAYVPDANGKYVRMTKGGKYYTLYNPAVHTSNIQRFSKIDGFTVATDEQVSAGTELYVWDGTAMAAYTTQSGTIYFKGGNASALVLQRLAATSVSAFNSAFNSIGLSDVMNIDADIFGKVADGFADMTLFDETTDYYYYADGLYLSADVFDAAFQNAHPNEAIYEISVLGAGNSVIKKLAYLKIEETANRIDEVVDDTRLSEVINIDGDEYSAADVDFIKTHGDFKYYLFSNGIYEEVPSSTVADVVSGATTPAKTWFYVSRLGTSHALLKKMAKLRIGEMGSSLERIINGMYLDELVEIYENYEVAKDTSAGVADGSQWLIAYDPNYTETVKGAAGEADVLNRFAFVYDTSGKYYRTQYYYAPAADGQKVAAGTLAYGYTPVYTGSLEGQQGLIAAGAALAAQAAKQNVYIKDTAGAYHSNPALAAYLATQGRFDVLYFRDVNAADKTESAATYLNNISAGASGLYVQYFGSYYAYDPANPAHIDMPLYFKYTQGYFMPTADVAGSYYFDADSGSFTTQATAGTGSFLYTKLNADTRGDYYYSRLDSAYNALKKDSDPANDPLTYSKQRCEAIFYADPDGSFVLFDGDYVTYDPAVHVSADLQRFTLKIGYVANNAETMTQLNGNWDTSAALSADKIVVNKARSAPVLTAFAKAEVTIDKLGSTLDTFKLGELMEIAPDSIFDNDALLNADMKSLGTAIQNMLQGMSIGQILEWGNITTLSPEVLSILRDVSLENFFASLKYKDGMLYVDLPSLYNIEIGAAA